MSNITSSSIGLNQKPKIIEIGRVRHYAGTTEFLLPAYWSLHLYDYKARFFMNEREFEISPGSVTLVPPDTVTRYELPHSGLHTFAHFQVPPSTSDDAAEIPVVLNMGEDLYHFECEFIAMGRAFLNHADYLRAEIKLWDLLWDLARHNQTPVMRRHPCVEKALAIIEARLGDSISVQLLAREVGLSRHHLTRLFQFDKEMTIVAYVRQQRARLAKHLLQTSSMSISDVANQVHSPNLQSFSAMVKKETGHSPSHWRRQLDDKR